MAEEKKAKSINSVFLFILTSLCTIAVLWLIFKLISFLSTTLYFTVQEQEFAVVTKNNIPVTVVATPGRHQKKADQKVVFFPAGLLSFTGEERKIINIDKIPIQLQVSALWQITDPLVFYKNFGNSSRADSRAERVLEDIIANYSLDLVRKSSLDRIIRSSDRVHNLKKHDLAKFDRFGMNLETLESIPVLEKGRDSLEEEIKNSCNKQFKTLGLQLDSLYIVKTGYSEDVLPVVYENMVRQWQLIAAQIRVEIKRAEIKTDRAEPDDMVTQILKDLVEKEGIDVIQNKLDSIKNKLKK